MDSITFLSVLTLLFISLNHLWVSVFLYIESSRFGKDGMNWMLVGLLLGLIGLGLWALIRLAHGPSAPAPAPPMPPQPIAYRPPPGTVVLAPPMPPSFQPGPPPAYPPPLGELPPPPLTPPPHPVSAPWPAPPPRSVSAPPPAPTRGFDPHGAARPFVTFFAALFFATFVVMAGLMTIVLLFDLDPLGFDSILLSPIGLVVLVAVQDITLVCFVYVQMFKPGHLSRIGLGLVKEGAARQTVVGLMAGAGLFAVALALESLMAAAGLSPAAGEGTGLITASGGIAGYLLLLIATVGLAPPTEELFFRGYMQTVLDRKWGPAAGLLVSALFFAVMHMELFQLLPLFIAGVILGLLFRRFGLTAAISCHAMNNLLALTAMFMLA